MTFDDDALKKSHETQRKKYGGDKGYSAEMRRRNALRKTFGTGGWRWMKEHDPDRFKQIIDEREEKRRNAKPKEQDFLKDEDQADYISALTQED